MKMVGYSILTCVLIAACYTIIGGGEYGSLSQDRVINQAKSAVKKALKLDDSLAEGLIFTVCDSKVLRRAPVVNRGESRSPAEVSK